MTFTDRFYQMAEEMAVFLEETSIETLITHGFKVGTAVKLSSYTKDELMNTTVRTLQLLTHVMVLSEEGVVSSQAIDSRFDTLVREMLILIQSTPPKNLSGANSFSTSTVSNIRTKGIDGNYQTSKLLMIADLALDVA